MNKAKQFEEVILFRIFSKYYFELEKMDIDDKIEMFNIKTDKTCENQS